MSAEERMDKVCKEMEKEFCEMLAKTNLRDKHEMLLLRLEYLTYKFVCKMKSL